MSFPIVSIYEVVLFFRELIDILTREGELLYSVHSTEFLIRNMLLSTLKIVREEALRLASGIDEVSIQTESLNVRFLFVID